MADLKESFRPEFLNRVDRTVVFHPLSKDDIKKIIKLQLHELSERIKFKGLSLTATPAAIDTILELSYDPAYGARPIRRVIQDRVENQISEALLAGDLSEGNKVEVDSKKKGEISVKKANKKRGLKKKA